MPAEADADRGLVIGRGVSRSLLPSSLLSALERAGEGTEADPAPRRARRTTRDWFVDIACFVVAAVGGALLLWAANESALRPHSDEFVFFDIVCGGLATLALWWRRRWPGGVALLTAAVGAAFSAPGAASLIALFTVAVHRRLSITLALAGVGLLSALSYYQVNPQRDSPFLVELTLAVVMQSAVIAWGLFVQARRRLLLSLRDRAERAEAEQRLLAEQARRAERTRIAREMHDVLAHRVSLIALHAGALEIRADLPPEAVRETAGVIRSTARQALEELRSVIGVLRDPSSAEESATTPQPTLGDVPRLVSESARAGVHVDLDMQVTGVELAPATLGRDAYRIVQEALTNVSKHARGTATRVSLRGGPGSGLRVRIANRLPLGVARAGLSHAGLTQGGLPHAGSAHGGLVSGGSSGRGLVSGGPSGGGLAGAAVGGGGPAGSTRSGGGPAGEASSTVLPAAVAPASGLPGAGAGLLGLRERVLLAGGTITHGATADGEFVVEADLEWPAAPDTEGRK